MTLVIVPVWEMTDEELEQQSNLQRDLGDEVHANELLAFRDMRRERCPVCRVAWSELNVMTNARTQHIAQCANPTA